MKLTFTFFCKNLLLNILIAAQICASAVFGMMTVSVISKSFKYYNISKNLTNAYAYMPNDKSSFFSKDSVIYNLVEKNEIIISRSKQISINNYNKDCKTPQQAQQKNGFNLQNVYCFGNLMSEAMRPQLKKGKWFSDKVENGIIECVIVSTKHNFPIGMIIEGAEYLRTLTFEDKKLTEHYEILQTYKFKVVGTLGQSAEILTFPTTSFPADGLTLSKIFDDISYEEVNYFEKLNEKDRNPWGNEIYPTFEKPELTILCSSNAFYDNPLLQEKDDEDIDTLSLGSNALFEFADSVTEERKKEILYELKEEGGIIDLASRREIALVEAKNDVAKYLPLMLCFVAMVVVGVICVSALSMLKNKQTFKTYIYCGMSFLRGVRILIEYTLILLSISGILTLASWYILSISHKLPWYSMDFGTNAIVFVILDFIIAGILILATSLPLLKKFEKDGVEK